ncbi:CDGSH iron-sulfur domain-containing protein [Dietzia cercidiphylli]|uniref:CDGSH iron-sulfur domain-containing protein n=1 Tax=Dietzia cercidiphylli TaxID=498199 RepID=UPI002883445B|nr:CDGSH iron-sulfur domain-containing protein [Dietzia cercidiphylli]
MSTAGDREARVVQIVPGGPMLVEGPVDLITDDGARVCSDRFMVAVCTCRRSKTYPLCDTSHRRKIRATPSEAAAEAAAETPTDTSAGADD